MYRCPITHFGSHLYSACDYVQGNLHYSARPRGKMRWPKLTQLKSREGIGKKIEVNTPPGRKIKGQEKISGSGRYMCGHILTYSRL